MIDVKSLNAELTKYGQEHLLQFWEQLSEKEKEQLYADLKSINYEQVSRIFKKTVEAEAHIEKIDELLQPLSNDVHESITRTPKQQLQEYMESGLREISEGRVAVLLLAGGQGTRLGVNYPKGMYDVGLPSHKTLYQLQGERIRKAQQLAHERQGKHGVIPWYIMTSEATREPTQEFFEKNNFFGLGEENVRVFEQNTFPCFTLDGKIILESHHKVARAPDGNGGLYWALDARGILDDMQKRGVEYVHVYGVDNLLVKIADPTFIGYCIKKKAAAAAKVVEKAFPTEAVGIFSKVNGKYQVVEYSEVSLQTAQKRNPDGRLTFNAGNIVNHFFTLDFLKSVCTGKELKHHIAKKKIPYIDVNGKLVKPEKPNGIKLEKFVFDVFEFTDKFVVWEILREDEFSAIKNADGADKDTPTTARLSLFNLHQRHVLNAGGKFIDENGKSMPLIASPAKVHVNGNENGMTNGNSKHQLSQVICEISPMVSYDGEGLEKLVAGKTFGNPLVLMSAEEETSKMKLNGHGTMNNNNNNELKSHNGMNGNGECVTSN